MTSPEKLRYGSYEVLQNPDRSPCILGQGCFGVTYKARHMLLGRINVLKLIRKDLLNHSNKQDQEETERFLKEARAAGNLHHPGIAVVHDCGLDNGVFYYAMEYCDGGTLKHWCRHHGPLPWPEVRQISLQLASALAYAHASGLLHRDIKPSNIMLHGEGDLRQIKLIDFGLAKDFACESESSITFRNDNRRKFRGNLATASPEQLREMPLYPSSDLFSLGISLWWLLLGKNPFSGMKAGAMVADRLGPASYASSLPADLDPEARDLLDGLLEKDASKRIATAGEVMERLGSSATPNISGPDESRIAPLPLPTPPALENCYSLGVLLGAFKQAKLYQCTHLLTSQPLVAVVAHCSLTPDTLSGLRVAASRKLNMGTYAFRDWCISAGDDVFVLSKPVGCSLRTILTKLGPAGFSDLLPFFAHLARCFDASQAWTSFGIQVNSDEILLRTRDGGSELKHFHAWSDLDPYAAGSLPLFHSSADRASSDTSTLSPLNRDVVPLAQFAALIYRVLTGRNVLYSAFFTTSGYMAARGLSEGGNALLANTLCATDTQAPACHLVQKLARLESLPLAKLTPLVGPPTATDLESGKASPTPSAISILAGSNVSQPSTPSKQASQTVPAARREQVAEIKHHTATTNPTTEEKIVKCVAAEQAHLQTNAQARQAADAKSAAGENVRPRRENSTRHTTADKSHQPTMVPPRNKPATPAIPQVSMGRAFRSKRKMLVITAVLVALVPAIAVIITHQRAIALANGKSVSESPGALPGKTAQASLIKQSMQNFATSVNRKDMGHFHREISQYWQNQVTSEELKQAFAPFIEKEIDLTVLEQREPTFEGEPIRGKRGTLVLRGHYPTKPNQVHFEQKFICEGSAWKLVAFGVDVK